MDRQSWIFDDELQSRRAKLEASGCDAYCLYCTSGREVETVRELNRQNERFLALPFLRMMHKSVDGKKMLIQDVLLKGYVFLFAPQGADVICAEKCRDVYFVLGKTNGVQALEGNDLKYAQWVLSFGGIVGVSKALKINERVKIISGPLLDFEGCIKEYSKKGRNCRVEIDIVGQQLSAWLPFDWVESRQSVLGGYGNWGLTDGSILFGNREK